MFILCPVHRYNFDVITSGFNIAAVERDTGLSKDVLRVWERRYGFPLPERDPNGDRSYPPQQVERLRLIKRLMDLGHRPGKLLGATLDELALLTPPRETPVPAVPGVVGAAQNQTHAELNALMMLIKRHDADAFLRAMQMRLAREGVHRLVVDTVAPLTIRVGQAWSDGEFAVFEEHLFSELTQRILRQTIASLPATGRSPRVLMTTVPNELHGLGLLMTETLLALNGAECIPLGTQLPVADIHAAAEAHRADIVALSFSSYYPRRQTSGLLQQLRQLLATDIALWVGGSGAQNLPSMQGVKILPSLEDAITQLEVWRAGEGRSKRRLR